MHPTLRRNRPFVRLWFAQIASNVGDQCYAIALVWYLLERVESPSALSLLSIPEMIAGLLFTLLFGAIADRTSPRALMIRSDLARFALALAVFAMMLGGVEHLGLFMGVQFGIGLFVALFAPARTVAVRAVVPPELMNQANALQDTTFRAIRIAAPMAVAALSPFVPLPWLVFVNACAYALSAAFVWSAGQAAPPPTTPSERMTPARYARDILEAARALRANRTLLFTILFGNMGFLAWQMLWTVGFPVLAADLSGGAVGAGGADGASGGWLGVIVGCYGAGNLLGSLVMTRLSVAKPFRAVLLGWLFLAAGYAVIAAGASTPWIVCLGAAIGGIGGPVIGIPLLTAIQTMAEPRHTGKIYSVNVLSFTAFCIGSSALGALGVGDWPPAAMFGWGAAFLVAMVAVAFASHAGTGARTKDGAPSAAAGDPASAGGAPAAKLRS
ncbi:MFS transporter [Paenibacillus sp.]|uniref:MFS transporter n=1 Tax=Paenibacillus sp. TaxID=58172 RepID=UPI002D4CCF0E|nr:MFS transporter [Paenibacillus sp.]HZG56101.1 MFS transporter [Paenibacillus sp.]